MYNLSKQEAFCLEKSDFDKCVSGNKKTTAVHTDNDWHIV